MQNVRPSEESFGLVWALGLSVVAHALLALFFLLFMTISDVFLVTEIPEPEEERITFTFAPDEDRVEDDSIFEEPPPPPALPTPESEPVVAPAGMPLDPVPPSVPVEPQPPRAQPTAPPEERIEPAETLEALERIEPADEPGADQPIEPEALDRRGDRPAAEQESRPAEVDMHQALRNFSRAIAQAPRPETGGAPPSGVPKNVFVPDFSQIPQTGFGVGNLVFESRDYDWSDYGRQVYMALWRAWHNRLWQTTDDFNKWAHKQSTWHLDHQTQARFVIERNGQVTGIVRESGSGCEPLDDSALDALAEVILPPLPAGFPRNREVVHILFHASGPIRHMRPHLGRLKAMGLF